VMALFVYLRAHDFLEGPPPPPLFFFALSF
jgi:hypothetical protein